MKRLGPMGILLATIALFSVFQFASVAVGTTSTKSVADLTSRGLGLTFVVWIMADAQRRRRTPCYEFGFLVAVYFPLSLVWYLLWSRGWRGMLLLASFFGLMLLPWFSAIVAWILRYGLS